MIIGFFLQLLYGALSLIVSLMPTYAFPTQISTGITTFWGYVNLFSMVIPVSTIAACFVIMTVFYTAEFAWQAAHWILRRFKR